MLFAGFISFAFLVALVAHATTRRQLLADIVAASISTLAWLLAGTIAAGYQDKLLFVAAIGAFGASFVAAGVVGGLIELVRTLRSRT